MERISVVLAAARVSEMWFGNKQGKKNEEFHKCLQRNRRKHLFNSSISNKTFSSDFCLFAYYFRCGYRYLMSQK